MFTNQTFSNAILANEIADKVRDLKIKDPTFVAGTGGVINMCRDLAKTFDSDYAFIKEEDGQFGPETVLYGKINPTAILFITKKFSTSQLLEDLDIVKCAGARRVLVKRLRN